ncbi:hypothetical protein LTR17_003347 [Elasticomyces elasticus]|nr:hypothetical protein LTR17_003347 [Elasticomyces elasticus]
MASFVKLVSSCYHGFARESRLTFSLPLPALDTHATHYTMNMNLFRSSPAPTDLKVEILVGRGEKLSIDHAKVSANSSTIKGLVEQHIAKSGRWIGKKEAGDILSLDFPDTTLEAWHVYINYTTTGALKVDESNRQAKIKRMLQCITLGKRIHDMDFANQAEAALNTFIESTLGHIKAEAVFTHLDDILVVLSSSNDSAPVSTATCKLMAQYAVIKITDMAEDEINEQKYLATQAVTAFDKKELQLQRSYDMQARLSELEAMASQARDTLVGELGLAHGKTKELEGKLAKVEKELTQCRAKLRTSKADYELEVHLLKERLQGGTKELSASTSLVAKTPTNHHTEHAGKTSLLDTTTPSPSKPPTAAKPKPKTKATSAAADTSTTSPPAVKKGTAVKRKVPGPNGPDTPGEDGSKVKRARAPKKTTTVAGDDDIDMMESLFVPEDA